MNTYTQFATAYDQILKHVDYQKWYEYISSIMKLFIKNPKTVLELGCGTGRFGAKFSADDYQIYGLDNSLDMLRVAKMRAFRNFNIICADMANFYLSKKIDFIFSVHDTINYCLDVSTLKNVFRSVNNIMHEKSVFMFDITTEYNIKNNFDGKTNHYKIGNRTVEWSNIFNRDKREIHSTLKFTKDNGSMITEKHIQKLYSIDEIKEILKSEGLEILEIFGDYTFKPPEEDTFMINFITRIS